MTGVGVTALPRRDVSTTDASMRARAIAGEITTVACRCQGCVVGGICFVRYGTVVSYESAVRADDQRLRVLAQILAYVASTLAMPRAIVATVHPDGTVGAILARRPPADAEARRARYVESFAATDLLSPVRFMGTDRAVVTVTDVGGAERFRRTTYGAFLAAGEIEAAGAIYLRHHGRIAAYVGLLRDRGAPQLTVEELAAAHRLHPLIETAYACSLQAPTMTTPENLFDRARLTARERDVVRVAALGARNAEIASALYLSVSTVKIHLHHAFAKLGVHSRTELAARLQAADTTRP